MEKPTLVNFKHFMFKMVEPPLKEKKERNLVLILNVNQKRWRGLTCGFVFDEPAFMKPYGGSWNTA